MPFEIQKKIQKPFDMGLRSHLLRIFNTYIPLIIDYLTLGCAHSARESGMDNWYRSGTNLCSNVISQLSS